MLRNGGMRRTHLREHPNILKRLLIHVAGFNLGLVMRQRFGVGKPRVLQSLAARLLRLLFALLARVTAQLRALRKGLSCIPGASGPAWLLPSPFSPCASSLTFDGEPVFTTGC